MHLIACGCVSPVGLSAPATALACTAGIARITAIASTTVPGERGQPLPALGGRVPLEWLDGSPPVPLDWPGHEAAGLPAPAPAHEYIEDGSERLVRLAAPALAEALADIGTPPADWGLWLAVAPGEPVAALLALVRARGWDPSLVRVVDQGRVAALAALADIRTAWEARTVSGAVILAVDSRIRPTVLAGLAAAGRLRDEDHPTAPHPGEAAVVLVIGPGPGPRVLATALADEPTAGTDAPNQARGLATALRAVTEAAALQTRPACFSDLDGDRYRALEWGMAHLRTINALPHGEADDRTIADLIGDTGAAAGALLVLWAMLIADPALPAGPRLIWAAEDPRRAAVVIAPAQGT
jgi:3-oxoacyl-[acyl-carrier-protein] synthase I